MRLGKVVGQVVSTAKDGSLAGFTLLVLEPFPTPRTVTAGDRFVAVDLVGAGTGEVVLSVHGGAARRHLGTESATVDAAIVAIADTVILHSDVVYTK